MLLLAPAAPGRAEDYPLPQPPAVSSATRLTYTADHLDYDARKSTLHLKGHVLVIETTRTIKSDELWLDMDSRSGRSEGYLFVQDGDAAVAGESGEFFFEERAGHLKRASAGYGDWRVHAKEARLSGRKRLDYLSASFTSCDKTPPHYRFWASRITVVPKRSMLAYNTVFFLGPVPLFYLPVFYRDLRPEHLVRMKFQPGYDRRNGGFLKGTMVTPITPTIYNKLYLDYYSAQGLGGGTEFEHHDGDNRGALLGYYIHENPSDTDRWAMLGNIYQNVSSSIAVQGRLQLQSDADFNNHYARSSLLRVTPELINNGALVYRLRLVNMRLSYSRHDVASENRIHYFTTSETYPRFDLLSAPLKFGRLPWLNTLSAFAENNYERGRPFLQRSLGATWEATRNFNLAKRLSYAPKAAYQQTWFDHIDVPATFKSTDSMTNVFIGRYVAENTLRAKTGVGDWDLTHNYTRRLSADSFTVDRGAPDYGVERNLLSLADNFRPRRDVWVRLYGAYDFRVKRDEILGYRERVQPVLADVVYTPAVDWNVLLHEDYRFGDGNRSTIASLLYGDETQSYVSTTLGYSAAVADRYQGDLQFALSNASATWRAGASLRSEFFTSGGPFAFAADRFRLFEKELMLAHAWHDFFTKLIVRFRPGGVREGQIRIDLRFGDGKPRRTSERRDWEAEWFPERASGVYDRP